MPKFAPFADPLPFTLRQPHFARSVVSWMSLLMLSFRTIGWKMWELGGVGVEILAFPLTTHIAYTRACCYGTSRDIFIVQLLLVSLSSHGMLQNACI